MSDHPASDHPASNRPIADSAPADRGPGAIRRRRLLQGGLAATTAGVLSPWHTSTADAAVTPSASRRVTAASVAQAVSYLAKVTDAYRTSGPRLAQSYQDDSGLTDVAFVYDNALAVLALLAGGDVSRARAIGNALLFAQAHDETATDYRLRQAYHADTFVNGGGTARETAHFAWEFGLTGTAVGDMAWAGIALAQLARRTGAKVYRDGSLAVGRWIQTNTRSTTGLGGYTFGETAGLEGHKSTEHNIDVHAYFTLLAVLTGDPVWRQRAAHAWAFVERMWDAEAGYFRTGSDDGATVNLAAAQRPLDVQTWCWLASRQPNAARALDWAAANLATTDTPLRTNSALTGNQSVHGVAFSSGSLTTDPSAKIGGQDYNPAPDACAVWFEGTGQLALALADRGRTGDAIHAAGLLAQVRFAQSALGRGQRVGGKRIEGGVVAASSPMDTGFGFGYYPNLHVGATSWYVLAATGTNPYVFP